MPISPFRRSGGAAKPPTVADAAAILTERKAYAAKAEAERDARHAAYRDAIAAAGAELDTPEIERAGREWNRAIERHDRAHEAVRVAEIEHAAALKRAQRGTAECWDEVERLAAARTKAAAKFATLAADTAAAHADFLRAAQSVRAALPAAARGSTRFDVFTAQAAAGQARAELERVGVIPDPRRPLGLPAAKPLAEISAELAAMVKRARDEPEATPHEITSADRRTMVRPVPDPDREPERAQ